MIEYPAGLPLPDREGYRLQHVDPMQRTQLASGRARNRRRFTSVPSNVPVSWLMTQSQAQLFEAWYRDEVEIGGLGDGVEWFLCPLQTPLGIQQYEARFTGIYRGPELVGVSHWRFTAELELRERQILPRGWAMFPDYILLADIIDKAANKEWPEAL